MVNSMLVFWHRLFGRTVEEKLRGREVVDLGLLFDQYGLPKAYPRDQWMMIWCKIAEIFGIHPGKLRSEDSFLNELSPENGILGCDSTLDFLNDWIAWMIPDDQSCQVETLGELVDYLFEHMLSGRLEARLP